jgi:hypothetical protein
MASVTIDTSPAQDQRLAPAFGDYLGLTQPGTNTLQNANVAQVKQALIDFMRGVVLNYERKESQKALAQPAAFDPT